MTALERVRDVIERVARAGSVVSDADGTEHRLFPVAFGREEGDALRRWIVRERAASTVEIGLGYGVGALFACAALLEVGDPGARHVTIDPHQHTRFGGLGLQLLREAGVAELVEHHGGDSELVLPRLASEERSFDAAVVDGNHRFDGVFVDLVLLRRLLRPGAIVFVDDLQLPAVAKAVAFCTSNLGWTVEEQSTLDELHHWFVLRTAAAPDARPFDHFVDF